LFEDFTDGPDDELVWAPEDELPAAGGNGRAGADLAHADHDLAHADHDLAHADDGSAYDTGPIDDDGAVADAAEPPSAPVPTAPEPRSAGRWIEPGALAAQQAQRARNGELTGPDGDLASARLLR